MLLKRVNLLNNRNLGLSPYEIATKSSIFKNVKKKLEYDKAELIKKLTANKITNLERETKKFIKHDYKVGDYVFTKNFDPDKVTKRWNGPFIITKIRNYKNTVFFKKPHKTTKVSIKNINPFKQGEDVEHKETKEIQCKINH
ncbi:hypothetical protein DMUE_1157 [Dictyocoela muelleri]|nr:hypothetical protein DMUE_1157 [Dictyocoela muelleri]